MLNFVKSVSLQAASKAELDDLNAHTLSDSMPNLSLTQLINSSSVVVVPLLTLFVYLTVEIKPVSALVFLTTKRSIFELSKGVLPALISDTIFCT